MIKLWFPVNEEIAQRTGNVSIIFIVLYIYDYIKLKYLKTIYILNKTYFINLNVNIMYFI